MLTLDGVSDARVLLTISPDLENIRSQGTVVAGVPGISLPTVLGVGELLYALSTNLMDTVPYLSLALLCIV